MIPTTLDYDETQMSQRLMQLSVLTGSDLSALGIIDHSLRKVSWLTIVGSISSRTPKIRQSVQFGLVGEVLRTGSFLQLPPKCKRSKLTEEAIMITEKLSHAAAWPIHHDGKYSFIVFIGKRTDGIYEHEQINAGTNLITDFKEMFGDKKQHTTNEAYDRHSPISNS